MNETKKILVVDDDEDILEFLSYNLRKEGYDVNTAENGLLALKAIEQTQPDLIILDIMMPVMDGIEACKKIRKNAAYDDIIIAFLTAKDEDYTQIIALEIGGDDFISKPVRPSILISRIKALLRRNIKSNQQEKSDSNVIFHNDLVIDKEKILVLKEGRVIELTKKEFEILTLLVSRVGKVFTREEIYFKIWSGDIIVGDRTIDVHIRNLREKIGEHNIGTVKGVGYRAT